jgi:hypothetical protein
MKFDTEAHVPPGRPRTTVNSRCVGVGNFAPFLYRWVDVQCDIRRQGACVGRCESMVNRYGETDVRRTYPQSLPEYGSL